MQSQYEDLFECGNCCVGYAVLDLCWLGVCKFLGMEQITVERMGEKLQGKI